MARAETPQVDITVLPPLGGGKISRKWLRGVALAGLKAARSSLDDRPAVSFDEAGQQASGRVQLGLVIADDETLQRLNEEYRGTDEVTDVLAFSWAHQGHWEGSDGPPKDRLISSDARSFPWLASGPPPIGEVIVSYPQAERQAQAHGHSTEKELALLLVHGILHLVGYDHGDPDQEAEMKEREQVALSWLFGGQ